MTSKDFIEAEAGNNGSIILYREGFSGKLMKSLLTLSVRRSSL